MPQASAISSIALSRAALPGASPGARMNSGVPVSIRTASCRGGDRRAGIEAWEALAAGSMKSSNVLVAVLAWWLQRGQRAVGVGAHDAASAW